MKNNFSLKVLCTASLLAMGLSVHAAPERYIVKGSQYLKNGHSHKMKAKGHNWFAIELDENGKNAMRYKTGFESIEHDPKRYPMALFNDDVGDPTVLQLTPYAIYQSQANQLSLQAGQKVCVIDSGIAGSVGETGGQNNDFDWSVITGDNDSGTGNWFADGGAHGTHVAGTVAAVDNGYGVVGTAPGVPLHIIKVFNEAGYGYSSDLAQAAELCGAAGANIITMSLGGGGANSAEENAFASFTANGGLVLAAAGNDGNTTRSYPAGYEDIMMIGANDADNVIASFSQHPSCTVSGSTKDGYCVEVSAGGVTTLSTYPSGSATLASISAGGVGFASTAFENEGTVSESTYYMGTAETTDSGANGKICMIDRGNISFNDKALNCQNSGGVGAIIINNISGVLSGTLGTTNVAAIPVAGADFDDRSALLAATTASINIGAGDYGYLSGTSMSTPAVAGVAALVWSNHPACTGSEIRNALKATAQDQGTIGKDVFFGYGIVKAKDANDYLTANGCAASGPSNAAPVAVFDYSCTELNCSFSGSGSSDSDGTIVSYAWSFGETGLNVTNTFASTGTYSVTLTVTDDDGATDTSTQNVTVSQAPVNINPTSSFTQSCNDLVCSFDASNSSDADGSISSYSWNFGDNTTDAGSLPIHTYNAAGTYSVTLTVTDDEGATDASTQAVTVTQTPIGGDGELSNGVAKTGLSGATGNEQFFTLEVPAGATNLNFAMSGGSGDADLYVRFGSQPTTTAYDCRPFRNGNSESCPISNAQSGTYHVMVRAYAAYSGVSVTGSFDEAAPPPPPGSGDSITESNLSANRNQWLRFTYEIPAGMSNLTATISGGSGDADLYVRRGAQPTTASYDCRPYRNGNAETCSINNPANDTYHISIRAYRTFSNVTLNVDWE